MLDKILFLPCPLLLCLIEILLFISYIFLSNLNLPDYASWYKCSVVMGLWEIVSRVSYFFLARRLEQVQSMACKEVRVTSNPYFAMTNLFRRRILVNLLV